MELNNLSNKTISKQKSGTEKYPVRIIQFGEGNFLRAFIDWMISEMNKQGRFKGKINVIQPLPHGMLTVLEEQDYLYTLLLRGMQDGEIVIQKEIIDVIERGINVYTDFKVYLAEAENPDLRFVVSNTTEAGIVFKEDDSSTMTPPESFPGKLLVFLKRRFEHFEGDPDKGLLFLPCELIDRNGDNLKSIILKLAEYWYPEEAGFRKWLINNNVFFNTLVDRIVSGYPKDEAEEICKELGYNDRLLNTGELFHLFVIEGDKKYRNELPFCESGLNVIWTDNIEPYRTRKVRILNGAHTMTVLSAWLYGLETVKDCMDDDVLSEYIRKGIYEEIIPTLELPKDELESYGHSVLERFSNPYLRHYLLTISLNSVSKFKTRVLPSLLTYAANNGKAPEILSFSLSALVLFYKGQKISSGCCTASRGIDGKEYQINDSKEVLEYFMKVWTASKTNDFNECRKLMSDVLSQTNFWGRDLNSIPGLTDKTSYYLYEMIERDVKSVLKSLVENAEG